jgi:N-acyl amino acid synthase of PEP-CTERM/exosortase system
MFDQHFEVFLADTHESKAIHYSIRYQVYCEEMGFENKDSFPLEQEFDEHDKYSDHFIVRTRLTGQWVGAMRLIFKNNQLLPVEKYCILTANVSNDHLNRSIEISRLCLIKDIRRRIIDTDPPIGLPDENQEILKSKNIIPFYGQKHIERSIIWGLFRAAAIHSKECKIQKWYFLSTRGLARIIGKTGCNMEQIGQPLNYNGERIPFEMSVNEILSNPLWFNDFKKDFNLYSVIKAPEIINTKAMSA